MRAPEPGLALQYVREVADFLADEGVDVDAVLRRHGMSAEVLASSELVIPFSLFEHLVTGVLEEVNEPALGILVGDRLATATHGALGQLAVSSATTRQLLELVERFLAARITVLSLSLHRERRLAGVVLNELLPMGSARPLVLEAVLLSVKNLLKDASMGRCPVARVDFPFPRPAYAELAEERFGCPVIYDAGHAALLLPASALEEPLRMADPRALELAASLCEREIDKLGASRSFEIRTRKLMLERPHGFPSMAQVARRLHVTSRTLDRKLRAEGTSYRAIIDDLRHRMAVDLIQSGSNMDEVAYLLGYTDTSNFRRAFRRWTGAPPSSLRDTADPSA